MKQRLIVALYLLSDAQCLLMDEVMNGIDEASRIWLKSQLSLLKKQGKIIIISSHYHSKLTDLCDELISFKQGLLEVI